MTKKREKKVAGITLPTKEEVQSAIISGSSNVLKFIKENVNAKTMNELYAKGKSIVSKDNVESFHAASIENSERELLIDEIKIIQKDGLVEKEMEDFEEKHKVNTILSYIIKTLQEESDAVIIGEILTKSLPKYITDTESGKKVKLNIKKIAQGIIDYDEKVEHSVK